jgi:hypothetical protein
MISPSMSLSTTTSMHGCRIKRRVLPIIGFAMASDHLQPVLLLQLGTKFTT